MAGEKGSCRERAKGWSHFALQNAARPCILTKARGLRKGLVAILLCKIAARPCVLDCSGNPFFPGTGKKDWSGKPGLRREAPQMRQNSEL
jgi:hypothetical protein